MLQALGSDHDLVWVAESRRFGLEIPTTGTNTFNTIADALLDRLE